MSLYGSERQISLKNKFQNCRIREGSAHQKNTKDKIRNTKLNILMKKNLSDWTRERKDKVNILIHIITIHQCLLICHLSNIINNLKRQIKLENLCLMPIKMHRLIHTTIIHICILCTNLNILEVKKVMIILLTTKKIRAKQETNHFHKNRKDKDRMIICHIIGHTIIHTTCLLRCIHYLQLNPMGKQIAVQLESQKIQEVKRQVLMVEILASILIFQCICALHRIKGCHLLIQCLHQDILGK